MTYIQTKEGSVSVRAGSMITHVSRVEGFRALTIAKLQRERKKETEKQRSNDGVRRWCIEGGWRGNAANIY
jgi:hypothetical protein